MKFHQKTITMLVLRLQTPSDPEPAWAVLEGNQPAEWTHGPWETLLPLTRAQQVVLLIPSRSVLLTRTTINTRNQRQLKQALPYALEDVIADDPENQHIVWQTYPDSAQVDVAVIDRTHLREWLSVLQAHQLRPNVILPDVFALPWQADSVTLWHQGDQVWVRTGELSGYASNHHALPMLLDALAVTSGVQPLRLYSDQPTVLTNDPRFQIIPETEAEHLQPASLQAAMKLNLLQGLQDESSAQLREQWQRWRLAAILAAIVGALAIGWYGADSFRLQRQLDTLDADNLRLFTELFPDAGSPDPRGLKNRLASELASLRGKSGQTNTGGALPPLAQFAGAFAQIPGLVVEEIRTEGTTVTVNLQAKEQQPLETLRDTLEKTLGKPVDMQSSSSADGVKATLTLGDQA